MKTNQEIVDRLVHQAREQANFALESSKTRHMLANTYAALALIEAALWAMKTEDGE